MRICFSGGMSTPEIRGMIAPLCDRNRLTGTVPLSRFRSHKGAIMPRISGVDIPPEKQIRISLRYLYGIGPVNAMQILKEANIDPMKKAKELNEDELGRIVNIIDRSFVVEGALRRQVSQNIQRLKDIASYRGSRHRRNLPVRGQRTRSNARTRKGPRKTVAGTKGVKELHG